eukprot:CAMPEP_0173345056 /NCGR_PEP_ID=MMETSP1144-20121109/11760_1 /TAXON_ID=483371 /ORGANISM="non described non described, Strain CCMP2298" /LENGTH=90 /DNA_ID=CAMNT_0014292137 /DNA_START=205 /DNA_END=477 /DNA_ORIENTATION=-
MRADTLVAGLALDVGVVGVGGVRMNEARGLGPALPSSPEAETEVGAGVLALLIILAAFTTPPGPPASCASSTNPEYAPPSCIPIAAIAKA